MSVHGESFNALTVLNPPECQMEVGTVIVIEFTFSLFFINWIILEEELLVNISMYRPHEPSGRVRISLCN